MGDGEEVGLIRAPESENEADEIRGLQRAWMQAWIDGDTARCEALVAPEFRLRSVATDSIIDREAWLHQMASGRISGTEFEYEQLDVRVVGDTAVTMSRTRQVASINGRDWSATLHVTDVWVRRDGDWSVVARHASPLVGRVGDQET
jgi:uncharacterized protein (TIGR02246 family)